MTKKRLTKNQQRRIQQNQENNSNTYGLSKQGLVISHYGQYVDLIDEDDHIISCNLRQNLTNIAVGDLVLFETNTDQSINVVTKVLARKSVLIRTNPNKPNAKPIAANIDQLFIVFAVEPRPQTYLIDQFIIIAENSNIQPILILNKYDLFEELNDHALKEEILKLVENYKKIGYQVITVSGLHDKNYSVLNNLLTDKTSIFVGQSGVGKSTITQKLIPDVEIATGAISQKALLGRHTTTVARLYHLPNSNPHSMLIDAPGIREMGVAHLSRAEIEESYIEFKPFLGKCKFKDCEHNKEPDCALKKALHDQEISPERWENYKKFIHL